MSFLTSDNDGTLTAQITRLLRDETNDNMPLLLEMIEGGGVNRRVLGYLFGISVFHPSKAVANKASSLLRQYAGADTQRQAEKLKEGAAYHYNEVAYLGKYRNPEFDIFDFILAHKMCNWHRAAQSRSPYAEVSHRTLNLANYPDHTFTDAIATLNFVRYVTLPSHRHFDVEAAVPLLLQLPVEHLYLESVRLARFPSVLFTLPNLKILSIKKGTYRPREPIVVEEHQSIGAATLEKLVIEGYPIAGAEHLGAFPALVEADITRCALESIDFLDKSTKLAKLNLRYNNLKDLPDFLGQMSQLTWLDLSGNPFQTIRIDLSQLYQLEHLELKWEKRSSAKKTELW